MKQGLEDLKREEGSIWVLGQLEADNLLVDGHVVTAGQDRMQQKARKRPRTADDVAVEDLKKCVRELKLHLGKKTYWKTHNTATELTDALIQHYELARRHNVTAAPSWRSSPRPPSSQPPPRQPSAWRGLFRARPKTQPEMQPMGASMQKPMDEGLRYRARWDTDLGPRKGGRCCEVLRSARENKEKRVAKAGIFGDLLVSKNGIGSAGAHDEADYDPDDLEEQNQERIKEACAEELYNMSKDADCAAQLLEEGVLDALQELVMERSKRTLRCASATFLNITGQVPEKRTDMLKDEIVASLTALSRRSETLGLSKQPGFSGYDIHLCVGASLC
ncbi:unnamed protein product, partial [Chrysoparadoxa australica]